MSKDWFPVIDYGKCIGCLACVSFCKSGVYSAKAGRPAVSKPEACPKGCRGCEPVCPQGAITHAGKSGANKGCKSK